MSSITNYMLLLPYDVDIERVNEHLRLKTDGQEFVRVDHEAGGHKVFSTGVHLLAGNYVHISEVHDAILRGLAFMTSRTEKMSIQLFVRGEGEFRFEPWPIDWREKGRGVSVLEETFQSLCYAWHVSDDESQLVLASMMEILSKRLSK